MAAFEAHRFKDISRAQLASAVSSVCPPNRRRELRGADKIALCIPLAAALVTSNVVKLTSENVSNLKMGDAKKAGTF